MLNIMILVPDKKEDSIKTITNEYLLKLAQTNMSSEDYSDVELFLREKTGQAVGGGMHV